jgi:riboflavin kinase/FMN adenylyltransferase
LKKHHAIQEFKAINKTIVTIGTYDGVHLGHKKILHKIAEQANQLNYESVVLTFFPHPRMVLGKDTTIKLLNTLEEKEKFIAATGIDHLIIQKFDEAFSNLSAVDFVKRVLVDQLNIGKIIIGYDHKFGKGRTADIHDLVQFGEQFGFEVEQISAEEIGSITVSSTKVRNSLLDGNIALANQFLGQPYEFSGKIVEGKKIGRTIDFPTANIEISETYKLLPKNGVYIVTALIQNINVKGMMNIGTNPTIGENMQSIEVHFFNFSQDIYNQNITIQIIEKIREEAKFDSILDLQIQLIKDKQYCQKFFENQQ